VVDEERTLSIGVKEGNTFVEETVTVRQRRIFTSEAEEDDKILPELEHGQDVILEGEVTRGNEMSNTIGISYGGHIVTGFPKEGSIVRFKNCLFSNCEIHGQVTRDHFGTQDSRRPKIIITKIELLEEKLISSDLFESDS
jgi:hypothetical protein